MYDYIHGVSYWYGNYRQSNLTEHIRRVNLKFDNALVYLVICMDDLSDDVSDIEKIKREHPNAMILYRFNTGGTIKSLWCMYKDLQEKCIQSKYISIWEDDQGFDLEYDWFSKSKVLLEQGYIMVGSLWAKVSPTKDKKAWGYSKLENVKRIRKQTYPDYIRVPGFKMEDVVWFDGNTYIMKYESLKIIEKAIGVFTLAPEKERYTYISHGIQHGELGFPTRLCNNGFKITTIPMEKWIRGLDVRSNHEPK